MLVKYWKNFKWFLFVPLILFVFFFNFKKVSALVYKGSFYSTYSNGSDRSGSVSANGSVDLNWGLNNYQFDLTKDYIGFQFGPFDISYVKDTIGVYCLTWLPSNTQSPGQTSYECGSFQGTEGESNEYNSSVTVYARLHYLVNNVNYWSPCTYEDNQSLWYCAIDKSLGNPDRFDVNIRNGRYYDNVRYNFSLAGFKYYYNNDSTEISIQQNTTNTNLQYIYQQQQDNQQYLESDSTSGASSQATGDFTELAQDFNEQLSGVNDLTQLVLLPISLFMDLATDNCQPLHLQIPYVNMSVDLPCMKVVFNQYFNGLYSIFTTIMSAVICYWVAVKTGSLIKDILDCDNDRIEVVDL